MVSFFRISILLRISNERTLLVFNHRFGFQSFLLIFGYLRASLSFKKHLYSLKSISIFFEKHLYPLISDNTFLFRIFKF